MTVVTHGYLMTSRMAMLLDNFDATKNIFENQFVPKMIALLTLMEHPKIIFTRTQVVT